MDASQPPKLFDTTNELAKERNRAAAERTLNAWIGNCLALIGVGIAFDQINRSIRLRFPGAEPQMTAETSQLIGMAFIGVSLLLLGIALVQHRFMIKAIEREDYVLSPVSALNRIVVAAILLIGAFGFLATFFIL